MSVSTPDMARLWGEAGLGTCPGLAQTFDRRLINSSTFAPATGKLNLSAIWLPAGMVVTNIIFYSGSTGVTTNTHNWAALYALDPSTSALKLLAQSTDDTSGTDFALNTKISKGLTAAVTTPYTGLYYLGWMQAASTPNLMAAAVLPASSIGNNDTPFCAATTADTGLTTTAPSPCGTLSALTSSLYGYIT